VTLLHEGKIIHTKADYQHNRNYDDFDNFASEFGKAASAALKH